MDVRNAAVHAEVDADIVRGHDIVGNVPMHIAAHARTVYAIEFSGPASRGGEYSCRDMECAGTHLVRYTVYRTNDLVDTVASESSMLVAGSVARVLSRASD